MVVATAVEGRPGARTVLLKGFDADGFVFFTNYNSRKGAELTANPRVALHFGWYALQRQIRIEGATESGRMKRLRDKTPSVFQRYNIVSDGDLRTAAGQLSGLTSAVASKASSTSFTVSENWLPSSRQVRP